jgi:hypothetical protein
MQRFADNEPLRCGDRCLAEIGQGGDDRGHARHGTAVAQNFLAFLDVSEF